MMGFGLDSWRWIYGFQNKLLISFKERKYAKPKKKISGQSRMRRVEKSDIDRGENVCRTLAVYDGFSLSLLYLLVAQSGGVGS